MTKRYLQLIVAFSFLLSANVSAQAPSPTPLRMAPVASLQFVQTPPKPNYDKSVLIPLHKAQTAARTHCDAVGGTLSGYYCNPPAPPPPPPTPTPVVPVAPVAPAPTGTCADWLAAAGITDAANAMTIINMESHCNPYAREPSSGACGVAQELPCGKSGCVFGDGACEVAWMNSYVTERYGSWSNAVAFHYAHGWY